MQIYIFHKDQEGKNGSSRCLYVHPLDPGISSREEWGGQVDDYPPIHEWFDVTRV
jgi:hypothetical protein